MIKFYSIYKSDFKIRNKILNSIKNVIMFLPSEVPFLFDFGSTTSRYLFDIIDEVTAGVVSDEIKRAILFCEPRGTFAPLDENDMDVASAYLNSTPRTIEDLMFEGDYQNVLYYSIDALGKML